MLGKFGKQVNEIGYNFLSKYSPELANFLTKERHLHLPRGLEDKVSKHPKRNIGYVAAGLSALALLVGGGVTLSSSICCDNGNEKQRISRTAQVSDDDLAGDDTYISGDNDTDQQGDDDTGSGENCVNFNSPYNLTICDNLNLNLKCDTTSCNCASDYSEFFHKAKDFSHPISEEELNHRFWEIDQNQVSMIQNPIPEGEFKTILFQKMNIEFLINGINERPLRVTNVYYEEKEDYTEKHLVFEDPYVGKFFGILLTPKVDEITAVVQALHGHSSDPEDYIKNYFGIEYPKKGMAFFSSYIRTMYQCGGNESELSKSLLLDGFYLLGLEDYESLLGQKYLEFEFPNANIGLIGHSGGSSIGDVLIRVNQDYKAYVSDFYCDFKGVNNGYYSHMTNPIMWPYTVLINNFAGASVPVLSVPYEYEDPNTGESYMPQIFAFFDENLKD